MHPSLWKSALSGGSSGPTGMDAVLAEGLSQSARSYVVNNLARMYATPEGKAFLERADRSQFTVTVGTGHSGRTDLTNPPPGTIVFGGQTRVEGGNTKVPYTTYEGHKVLAADNPNTAPGHPIEVTIDKSQAAEIGKDPAQVFAHVKAVEQILKPQCSTDDKGKKVWPQ